MSTDMLTVSRIEDTHAVPTAPPVSGPRADPAASALDPEQARAGFEELWQAFPRKHQRSKAKAAYEMLAPNAGLHSTLVARAVEWSEHYTATGTERKWWKHLHSWLAEERYLEDLPVPYENPKEAAIAKFKERGPKKTAIKMPVVEKTDGLSPATPIGSHSVMICGSELSGSPLDQERTIKFSFRFNDGPHVHKEFTHAFKLNSVNEADQSKGQGFLAELVSATGLLEVHDTSDMHHMDVKATVGPMGRIKYAAL